MPYLQILTGEGATYEVAAETTIGRSNENAIRLYGADVSRRHAVVRATADGGYEVEDLGSTLGTRVGGKLVQRARLRDGDRIVMGSVTVRFTTGVPDPDVDAEAESASERRLAEDGIGHDTIPLSREWSEAAGGAERDRDREEDLDPAALEARVRLEEVDVMVRASGSGAYAPFATAADLDDPEQLRRGYERLRLSYVLTQAIGGITELRPLLRAVLACLTHELGAQRGAILLRNSRTGRVEPRAYFGPEGEPLSISGTIVQRVCDDRVGILSTDAVRDERFEHARSVQTAGIHSALCAPLLYGDELVGVLYLAARVGAASFNDEILEQSRVLGEQIATAVRSATAAEAISSVERAQRERLQALVRRLPVALLVLSPELSVTLANAEAYRMLEGLVDFSEGAAVRAVGPISVGELLSRTKAGPAEIRFPGERERVLVATTAAIPSAGGGISETVLALRDVTELRLRERQAELKERLSVMGRLLGGVAHDFNNLLTIIIGANAMTKRIVGPHGDAAELVDEVGQAADRATQLVRQLLGFGRGESSAPVVLDPAEVVGGLRDMLARAAGPEVTLHVALPAAGTCAIHADRSRLEQVLLNLVVNARDAMPGGGRLDIGLAAAAEPVLPVSERAPLPEAPGWVRLTVTDTGSGMPPAVRARALEPFFTTKPEGKGTGLGLAGAAEFAAETGGRIGIASVEGEGTTITLELPMLDHVVQAGEVRRRPSDLRGDGRTLLLVEDEPQVRAMTQAMLARAGYTVTGVASMQEALEVLHAPRSAFDVILADVALPDGSGPAIMQQLPPQSAGLPVVYMTGYADHRLAAFGLSPTQSNVLSKPVPEAVLLGTLREALAGTAGG